MKNIALRADSVSASIGNVQILHSISTEFAAGRWTSVVGPNGAGKSTLLKALCGLMPCEGAVELGGQAFAQWQPKERAKQLAWLGQGEGGADDLSVYDVVMLGRLPHQAWLASPSATDHAQVEQALRRMQAWDWRNRALGALSGGERQRVLLARVLAIQAKVLVMDEPLANLDPPHQSDWLEVVQTLVAGGTTVISVLHELTMALQADEVLIMQAGHVLHHADSTSASTHQALEQVFEQRIQVRQLDGRWLVLPTIKWKKESSK